MEAMNKEKNKAVDSALAQINLKEEAEFKSWLELSPEQEKEEIPEPDLAENVHEGPVGVSSAPVRTQENTQQDQDDRPP